MRILLDTNILLRLNDGRTTNSAAKPAIVTLHKAGHNLCLVPQVIYEFWVVATRPKENNGLGLAPKEVEQILSQWEETLPVLPDEASILPVWKRLVTDLGVKGKTAHDTRIVAAMLHHDVEGLLSFSTTDFSRYKEIAVRTPAEVLGVSGFEVR
ncbi:MAG: type II toxin-antitoxin system VapC family toxin [Planctomycetaceae bacterium]